MKNIKVDFSNARVFDKNIMKYAKQVKEIHKKLHEKAEDKKEFLCGCHGGIFNSSGQNLSGPPPRPMTIPPFNINGTKLVFGEEGDIYKQLASKA